MTLNKPDVILLYSVSTKILIIKILVCTCLLFQLLLDIMQSIRSWVDVLINSLWLAYTYVTVVTNQAKLTLEMALNHNSIMHKGHIIIIMTKLYLQKQAGKMASSLSTCHTSVKTRVQIPRTHVNTRWVWSVPCNSSLRRQRLDSPGQAG